MAMWLLHAPLAALTLGSMVRQTSRWTAPATCTWGVGTSTASRCLRRARAATCPRRALLAAAAPDSPSHYSASHWTAPITFSCRTSMPTVSRVCAGEWQCAPLAHYQRRQHGAKLTISHLCALSGLVRLDPHQRRLRASS